MKRYVIRVHRTMNERFFEEGPQFICHDEVSEGVWFGQTEVKRFGSEEEAFEFISKVKIPKPAGQMEIVETDDADVELMEWRILE